MKADEGGCVDVGEHVSVEDEEGVVDPGRLRREPHGAGGVERLRLDGVRERDPGHPIVGKGREECVGAVAE